MFETLTALTIDSTDISLKQYQEIIANQPTYKIEKSKDTYINLSLDMKIEIQNDLLILIGEYKRFLPIHKQAFINNFDKWEIEESNNILSLIKTINNEGKKLNKEFYQLKRLIKRYSSLTSKIEELIKLNNDIINFTNQYLTRAKEADEASKFINNFVSNNQEVLKALA